ncbi:MAG: hypothetical protein DMG30_19230 [Acidobacteria bacterium]|nr:MAG: hypothetical protein DMG30_19230 [Acidobacteriota bacterium]
MVRWSPNCNERIDGGGSAKFSSENGPPPLFGKPLSFGATQLIESTPSKFAVFGGQQTVDFRSDLFFTETSIGTRGLCDAMGLHNTTAMVFGAWVFLWLCFFTTRYRRAGTLTARFIIGHPFGFR